MSQNAEDFQYVEGNPIFHSKINALLRFYAVRTGLLASALMPLLILFAGRNNFLQWAMMGLLNLYYVSRVAFKVIVVLFLVHSVCYSLYLETTLKKAEAYICGDLLQCWRSYYFGSRFASIKKSDGTKCF